MRKELFNCARQEKDQMPRLRPSLHTGAGKHLHGRRTALGVLDLIPEGFPMKPEVEIDGRGYTLNCDCDTIAEDAIRALQGEQHLYDEDAVNERSKV